MLKLFLQVSLRRRQTHQILWNGCSFSGITKKNNWCIIPHSICFSRICVPLLLLVEVWAFGCLFSVSESIFSLAFPIVLLLSHTPDRQWLQPKHSPRFCLHHCAHPHLHILFLNVKASPRRYIPDVKVVWWWEVHLCSQRGWIRLTVIHSDPGPWPPFRLLWSIPVVFWLFCLFLKPKAKLHWWLVFIYNPWFVFGSSLQILKQTWVKYFSQKA